MFYRETGQFKTSYRADQQVFPILQDRIAIGGLIAFMFFAVPFIGNDYWFGTILVPVLILSIAALGLNILTGYAGQLSLGTGGFMAAGAYMGYKVATAFPDMNIIAVLLLAGASAALIGMVFGIPSLRIKGFYLAVATLAAQFFLLWLFTRVPWFVNYSISGVPTMPARELFGIAVTGAEASSMARYIFVLGVAVVLAVVAKNLVRSHVGRQWMAIRDMDIAAEIIGIKPLQAKLSAFAVSSFYCGVAGALWSFCYISMVEPTAFDINRSFSILFMIIIGGLGSIMGSFIGAVFVTLVPIFLNNAPGWFGLVIATDVLAHIEIMVFGALIIFFLIVEPHGLARLWSIGKEKLRLWPFPH